MILSFKEFCNFLEFNLTSKNNSEFYKEVLVFVENADEGLIFLLKK